ncbi:expressed unknown protein [Seminavis robusta]|uniref:Uncharacterized protein n=1 Tax=Seminavis robusta TaxID=568900 RepID=A0A9N8D5C8_9STRA|nr:expressed unknown protein [Seminavis robusta]|eukprot:Sro8_g006690.1 n/a (425) ;mRNA; f:117714-118988
MPTTSFLEHYDDETTMALTPVPQSRAVSWLIMPHEANAAATKIAKAKAALTREMQEQRWKLQRRLQAHQEEMAMKKAIKAAAKKMQTDALLEYWTNTEQQVLQNKERWEREQREQRLAKRNKNERNKKLTKQNSMPSLMNAATSGGSTSTNKTRRDRRRRSSFQKSRSCNKLLVHSDNLKNKFMNGSPCHEERWEREQREQRLVKRNSNKRNKKLTKQNSMPSLMNAATSRGSSSTHTGSNKTRRDRRRGSSFQKSRSCNKLLVDRDNLKNKFMNGSPCYDWSTYSPPKSLLLSSKTHKKELLRRDSASTAATEAMSESSFHDSLSMVDLFTADDSLSSSSHHGKKTHRFHQSLPSLVAWDEERNVDDDDDDVLPSLVAWKEGELDECLAVAPDLVPPDFFDWETNQQSFNWESYGAFLHQVTA